MPETIPTDEAEELIYSAIATQHVSEHRWYDRELVIFERDGTLWGFHHDRPKTEIQEGMDEYPLVDGRVPIFPVAAKVITATVYEPVEEATGGQGV